MSTIKIILPSDVGTGKQLRNLLHQKYPSILYFYPDINPASVDFETASMIIVPNDAQQLEDLLQHQSIPKDIPILILGNQDSIPQYCLKSPQKRLVDYLLLPTSEQSFSHRIEFLHNVAFLAREKKAQDVNFTEQLEYLFSRDGLTGFFHRRQLTDYLVNELPVAQAKGKDLSLLIFNIDYFNDVNKTYGLDFGDFILNAMGARVTDAIEKPETCYRFSGEDFAILLPDQNLDQALTKAKMIRNICSKTPFFDGEHKLTITVSIGVTSLKEHNPDDYEKFIFMAENALFTAKAEGRDRIQPYVSNLGILPHQPKNPLKFLKQKLNRVLDKTRTSAIASLQLLAKTTAEPEQKGHVKKVSHFITLLGDQMGLSQKHQQTFQNSITLYTSFRFLLHSDLYSKPTKLSETEWKTVEDLPVKIEELIDMFDYFRDERKLLLNQSENYDGSGYPHGSKGIEIPLGARMIKIADALAAMSGDRAYRKKLTPREIIEELRDGAGKQFDPSLVLITLRVIQDKKLLAVDPEFLDQVHLDLAYNIDNLHI